MIVVKGRVSGRVVLLEQELPEGAEVDVRVRGAGVAEAEGVTVSDEQWAALVEAAGQARAGKTVDAQAVLAGLLRRR
jgi:hypothetical protein